MLREFTPLMLVVFLAGGSLLLAVRDPSYEPLFADLATPSWHDIHSSPNDISNRY